VTRKRD